MKAIASSAAGSWQVSNNGPKIIAEDFSLGFHIRHFVKDLNIAIEEAAKAGVTLAVANQVLAMHRALLDKGHGHLGTQALCKAYEAEATVLPPKLGLRCGQFEPPVSPFSL